MDPHHHPDFFSSLSWVDQDRHSLSPEAMETFLFAAPLMEPPQQGGQDVISTTRLRLASDFQAQPQNRTVHHHHHYQSSGAAPQVSPNGLVSGPAYLHMNAHMIRGPYTNSANANLVQLAKHASSSSSAAALSAFAMLHEETNSADATPESSDVEEENRVKRKKRAKKILSEDQTSEHTEHARVFPLFLESLRKKLMADSPDGCIQESAAISALIAEFTKGAASMRYTLPFECEQWLRRAAEEVNEYRLASKGSRKKKPNEYLASSPTGEKTYICHICTSQHEQKCFKTQEGLNLHIRNKHEKDKKWVCYAPGCTVSFVRQADLRMHMIRMHSPVRPFPCGIPFCLKSFAGVSELRRHVKVDHYKQVRELCGTGPILRIEPSN
jgi:hypothetical protein